MAPARSFLLVHGFSHHRLLEHWQWRRGRPRPRRGPIGPAEGYGTWPAVAAWCLDPGSRPVTRDAS